MPCSAEIEPPIATTRSLTKRVASAPVETIHDAPLPGPARFDQVLMRRLRIEGFFIPDFLHRGAEFLPVLRGWEAEGRLTVNLDETAGLENTLTAYARMLTGKAIGKVIVKVAA